MENTTMLLRGQVWYWEDPIYSRKDYNTPIPIGESTLRYNRYCIIVQDTNTIDSNNVLVIPCSSHKKSEHDIKIKLTHTFKETCTYARTRSIFPAHVKFLTQYICTLSDELINQIDAEILRLLMPAITENMNDKEIYNHFGIDMNYISNVEVKEDIIGKHVKDFVNTCIIKGGIKDIITPNKLKRAFDQYCIIHQIPIVDDMVEFLDSFTYATTGNSYNLSSNFNYSCMSFRKARIDYTKLKLPIDLNCISLNCEKETGEIKQKKRRDCKHRKWDEASIMEFLEFYELHNVNAVVNKYDMAASTARTYYCKFRRKVKQDGEEKPIAKKNELSIPVMDDPYSAISRMANLIKDTMAYTKLFSDIGTVKVNGKNAEPKVFYDRLSSILYFTLVDFLGVKRYTSSKDSIGKVNHRIEHDDQHISTWHFIYSCYYDKRISTEKNGTKMVDLYRKYYGDINTGIDKAFIKKLSYKLQTKFDIEQDDVNRICKRIQETFCKIS